MAKPAKVISNKSCVELFITMYNIQAQKCNFEEIKDLKKLPVYLHQYFGPFYQSKINADTVRPRDIWPQAAPTSQVYVFELGPKIFEMNEFML